MVLFDHGSIATKIKEMEKSSYWTEAMGDTVNILCEISGFCCSAVEIFALMVCYTTLVHISLPTLRYKILVQSSRSKHFSPLYVLVVSSRSCQPIGSITFPENLSPRTHTHTQTSSPIK